MLSTVNVGNSPSAGANTQVFVNAAALAGAGGNELRAVCTTCKPGLTNLLGAAASAETAVALLAMQRGEAPPIAGCDEPDPGELRRAAGGRSARQRERSTRCCRLRRWPGLSLSLVTFRAWPRTAE